MNKGKTILIWLLIVLLLGVIGFCGYRVVDKLNGNTSEENNVEEKKEEKKETDATSKATEKADKTDATSGATKQADSESSELVKKFKDIIFSSNEKLLANDLYNSYSKLTDFIITKIDETIVDGIATKYTIEAKYLCENKSWNCVYYSQVDESKLVKDSNDYYNNIFYYYVGEPYGSGLLAQSLPRSGPGSEFEGKNVETKTIYEK